MLTLLGDAEWASKAFSLAREIKRNAPYPHNRSHQGRLAKYELMASVAANDSKAIDESVAYWKELAKLEHANGTGLGAWRDLINDTATAGLLTKALELTMEARNQHAVGL